MRLRILGPLTLADDTASLAPRDRIVLAVLALTPRENVPPERIADALWGDEPPATWAKVVQGSVVRIRKALGPEAVQTSRYGYALVLSDDDIDATEFERLVRRGRELLALDSPERARYTLGQALDLWRGTALPDLREWAFARAACERWDELRRDAQELHIEAALSAGAPREVLAEAGRLVEEAPLREARWSLLARAQYQAGRQGEALATLRRAKAVVVGELGLDPGPDLAALEQAMLRQDPSLLPEVATSGVAFGCPYRGLAHYDIDDAEHYFGREAEVERGRETLSRHHVVAVVGPSGCGKSSLARAGIAAALRASGRSVAVLTPGPHPMSALAAAGGVRPGVVLVVDQLEEVVSLCADVDERSAFVETLVDHVATGGDLVVALRADRLGAVSGSPSLSRLIERGLLLLGAMSDTELRSAIEGPARQAGLLLEPGLVDVLVLEVAREPGALPMLSHALVQTWERREGRTLTVEGYRASGGVQRAVGQTAEEVFLGLDESGQRITRDLVLRLVVPGGANEPSRCRVAHRIIAPDAAHERIVDRLVAARLITSDGESVELAHESLTRAWPRLRAWLDDDTEGLLLLRHLATAADSWRAMGRPTSELYRGGRLEQALQWRRSKDPDLSETERAFLEAGEALARAESQAAEVRARREHRANRRLRRLLAGTVALLLVAAAAGGLALRESRRADDQARLAQVRELAAEAQAARTEDPQLALLLALEASSPELAGQEIAPEAVEALHAAVLSSRLEYIGEDGGGSVAWSADGELLATEGPEDSGLVDVRDAATGEPVIRFPGHDIDVNDVEFGSTGLLATAGDDGAVRVWDLDRREPVLELTGPGEAWHPTFSADGRRVAAVWREPGLIRVAEVQDLGGEVLSTIALGGFIFDAALSPDGASVAVGMPGRASVVVDVDEAQVRREILGHDGPVTAVSYSPDGRWLASGDARGLVRISDAASGQVTHTLSDASTEIARLAWDPASRLLATGSWDGTVRVYGVTDQDARRTTAVRDPATVGGVVGLAFSPDGARIAAGDFVATSFVVWDIGPHGNAEVHNVVSSPAGSVGGAFGPTGLLYTVAADGSVEVWDGSGERVRVLERPEAPEGPASFGSLVLSADGDLVGVGDSGEGVYVWDVESGEMLLAGIERADAWRPALAPDGQSIAVAADRAVTVYGVDGRQRAVLTSHGGAVPTRPVFSPDGTTVALIEERAPNTQIARAVVLWEWALGMTREIAIGTGNDIAYAPNGTRIAVADLEGRSRILDVRSGEVVLTLGVSSNVASVTYSPLGDVIATGGLDGTTMLWDADSGAEVLRLPSTGGGVGAVSFSPDGRRLATSSMAGDVVRVWTLDPVELRRIAAAEAVRDLTDVECLRFLHRACDE